MSAFFYDGPGVSFDKKTDEVIEEITTSYLIEYISGDLSASKDFNLKKFSAKGQGLLDEDDEAHGVNRIYEALQTCMWSNMKKVDTGPALAAQNGGNLFLLGAQGAPSISAGEVAGTGSGPANA